MTDAEAREYLLSILDDQPAGVAHIRAHVKASAAPLQILAILTESDCCIVAHEVIRDRLYEVNGYPTTAESVRSALKKLRSAIEDAGLPIKIKPVPRIGYEVITPPGWVPPWKEKPHAP